jgi:hypothetical protein
MRPALAVSIGAREAVPPGFVHQPFFEVEALRHNPEQYQPADVLNPIRRLQPAP